MAVWNGAKVAHAVKAAAPDTVQVGNNEINLRSALVGDFKANSGRLAELIQEKTKEEKSPKLLLIFDELPIALDHMGSKDPQDGLSDMRQLLHWLRVMRQNPNLKGKLHTIMGGSIGLAEVLRKHKCSAEVNDLSPFIVEAWETDVALKFLSKLGKQKTSRGKEGFQVSPEIAQQMLDLLGVAVPFHVQLFYDQLRQKTRGCSDNVTSDLVNEVFAQKLVKGADAHLEHYASRLEKYLGKQEAQVAFDVLLLCAKSDQAVAIEQIREINAENETRRRILRMLEEDGYLASESGTYAFQSNLLKSWWRDNWGAGR
jgi:hypothetical protein